VAISSAPGKGTRVKLYLPRAAPAPAAEEAQADDQAPRGRGERVLVVEDDPEVRSLVVRVLENLGYRVSDVPEAASAERLLEQEPVDLVLSDVVLPGGTSGPDFADALRARYPNIKVVFMSGYSAEAASEDGFLGEGAALLNKPFHMGTLAKALREALD
jgi:CheY-like chemotaxis protein